MDEVRAQGRQRLQEWLPRARDEAADRLDATFKAQSGLGRALAPYIREDNLDALVVYPAPNGGWHADVIFRSVPQGVADSIGSPVSAPLPTREDAESFLYNILVMILRAEVNKAPASSAPPVFILFDFEFLLDAKLLGELSSPDAILPESYRTRETGIRIIGEKVATLFPEGITVETVRSLHTRQQAELMVAMTIASVCGVLRFPPRPDLGPNGNAPTSNSRH